MFPHQQMATSLVPGFNWCRICTATCCDTGHSIWCVAAYSGGCGWSCDIGTVYAPIQPGDPIEQLQALRKQLEVALAGAHAQEKVLREQREGREKK